MAVCKSCSQPLVLDLEPEDFDEATSAAVGVSSSSVPDDLELRCKCHFHWQCLLDKSSEIAISLACPSCKTTLTSATPWPSATSHVRPSQGQRPQILTRYFNEGGVQNDLDILPLITEEAYLEANPSARPARAFMTMCGEGDVGGIVDLLRTVLADFADGAMSPAEILRYQDPLEDMKCGLHLGVENMQQEVVWLLLWLASGVDTEAFPEEAIQAAVTMSAGRETVPDGADIRLLKNNYGQTAGDVVGNLGNSWSTLLNFALDRT